MSKSKIEWTTETWNPTIGCDKVSPGCKNCYAINTAWIRQHNPKMAEKFAGTVEKSASGKLNWTGKVNYHLPTLEVPYKNKKPTTYFVNSMSDLFHENIPFKVIHEIYNQMEICHWHNFQILTKRPDRMIKYMIWFRKGGGVNGYQSKFQYDINYSKHIWHGVSVENQKAAEDRVLKLLQCPGISGPRFLSCEPLLGSLDLREIKGDNDTDDKSVDYFFNALRPNSWLEKDGEGHEDSVDGPTYKALDWVICGGESGKGARPMHPDWAINLQKQCLSEEVPYFFKQWGEWATEKDMLSPLPDWRILLTNAKAYSSFELSKNDYINEELRDLHPRFVFKVGKKISGRLLDNKEYNEMPGHYDNQQAHP